MTDNPKNDLRDLALGGVFNDKGVYGKVGDGDEFTAFAAIEDTIAAGMEKVSFNDAPTVKPQEPRVIDTTGYGATLRPQ